MEIDFITPAPGEEEAREIATQWAKDPKERRKIDKQLADLGHDSMDILSSALCGEPIIDAIDQRIVSYELRRMAALKAIEQYSEKLARRIEAASLEIIEGQFTEAAE